MVEQVEISHWLFMFPRDHNPEYNDRLDELRGQVIEKFQVPRWNETIEYVNHFVQKGWAQYPKFTFNSWRAHLKIEGELGILLYPALFTYSFPLKDAGTIGWWMFDEHKTQWGSAWKLMDILKKSNRLFVAEYENIDCQPRKV